MSETLGVDIGGVIIGHASTGSTGPDTMFCDDYLQTPAMEGAFDTIWRLRNRFGQRIHLVSKAKKSTQESTLQWLEYYDFYRATGVSPDHVEFCLERAEKHSICQRLGITHFVDDKLEVLSYLTSVPNRFLFRPNPQELIRFAETLSIVTRVESWEELVSLLLV